MPDQRTEWLEVIKHLDARVDQLEETQIRRDFHGGEEPGV